MCRLVLKSGMKLTHGGLEPLVEGLTEAAHFWQANTDIYKFHFKGAMSTLKYWMVRI